MLCFEHTILLFTFLSQKTHIGLIILKSMNSPLALFGVEFWNIRVVFSLHHNVGPLKNVILPLHVN